MHALTVDFTLTKEAIRPSRLRCNFENFKTNPPPGPGWEARAEAMLSTSSSSPALCAAGAASLGPTIEEPEPQQATEVDVETMAARMMNTRYYPHPSLSRGFLKLSGGRAKDWGIDLERAPGVPCPFWEAPRDRLEHAKGMPGSLPRVPAKAAKWTSQEAWDDASNHHSHKVGIR